MSNKVDDLWKTLGGIEHALDHDSIAIYSTDGVWVNPCGRYGFEQPSGGATVDCFSRDKKKDQVR
jgi:hypothetical protein